MKTTVYAVRDQHGNRLSYRFRKIAEAREAKIAIEHSSTGSIPNLEVYRTTQDLPRQYRKA